MRIAVFVLTLASLLGWGGCGSSGSSSTFSGTGDGGGDGAAADDASNDKIPGIETLGEPCEAVCGSADERKCALPSAVCHSDLCLVDPGHDLIAYCTVDCTDRPCPAGWDCEPIEAFSNEAVQRACVAQPASCGDGIVQLGEICDGDSPTLGKCVDCQRWEARCGDGVIQEGEACDGDTAEYYCLGCTSKQRPFIQFDGDGLRMSSPDLVSGSSISYMSVDVGGENARFDLPTQGDASGCGAVKVVETTAELTRVSWTLCNEDGDRGNFTMAFPRTQIDLDDWEQAIAPKWGVSADLQNAGASVTMSWSMDDMERFRIDTYKYSHDPPDNHTRGWYDIRLERDTPITPYVKAKVVIDLDKVEILHPPLAASP